MITLKPFLLAAGIIGTVFTLQGSAHPEEAGENKTYLIHAKFVPAGKDSRVDLTYRSRGFASKDECETTLKAGFKNESAESQQMWAQGLLTLARYVDGHMDRIEFSCEPVK